MKKVLSALGAMVIGMSAHAAADYPTQPVKLVIGFGAGGTTDVMGRILAEGLGKELGQQVIVENRAGASGVIGASTVANAKADGYTLLVGQSSSMTIPQNFRKLPYDTLKDFVPISQFVNSDLVLATYPNFPARTFTEFVSKVKSEPGKHDFGVSGVGSVTHIAGERLKQVLGLDIRAIPYKGDGPMMSDLMGGTVPVAMSGIASIVPLVQSGKLRALATTGSARLPQLPGTPTVSEIHPGLVMSSWLAVFAPAGTPPKIVDKLAGAVRRVMSDRTVIEKVEAAGGRAEVIGPQEFRKFLEQDLKQQAETIKTANITVD